MLPFGVTATPGACLRRCGIACTAPERADGRGTATTRCAAVRLDRGVHRRNFERCFNCVEPYEAAATREAGTGTFGQ